MEILHRTEQNSLEPSPLPERMDSAIGEASASIGMIMSELVRRSLRGGVGDIGTSLHDYARDQVGSAIDDVMPELKNTVVTLAESTAAQITSVAVDRISEDLKSVETRTAEHTQALAEKLKAEAETALDAVRREVGESRDTTESTARDLKELQLRARESWKKVQQELQNSNEARGRLEMLLSESQAQLSTALQQIETLRKGMEQFQQQQAATAELLENTSRQLSQTQKTLNVSQQHLAQTRQELVTALGELGELRDVSTRRSGQLESVCAQFEKRLQELERPRGIRALFSRMTGSGKNKATPKDANEEQS